MTAKQAKIEFDELDIYITGQLGKAAATLASQASTQARLDRVLRPGSGDPAGGTAGSPEGGDCPPAPPSATVGRRVERGTGGPGA